MTEIQGKSILVRVNARFELARVPVIGSQLHVSVSDRRFSFGFLMPLTIGLIRAVGCSDTSKFTEGSWQRSFTVNNERAVRTLKPSSDEQKCFERIP